MSNTFNISVAPELAALDTKIDTIDTVVDTIRATDVPDIQTNIDANETKIDLIRSTDVPDIQTNIDANETKIDLIRGTDVPNIQTNIDACETAIIVETDALLHIISVSASDYLLHTNANIVGKLGGSYQKCKETKSNQKGTLRILFSMDTDEAGTAYGKIYIDDVAVGTERSQVMNGYSTYSEDISVDLGQFIQIWVKHSDPSATVSIKDFIFKGDMLGDFTTVT